MLRAFTRPTGSELLRCELTHLAREPIDLARAEEQHDAYLDALRALGTEVYELPRLPDHPDAVFVEDTALVLPEVAVILRPGAASRRGETDSVAEALAPHREVLRLSDAGTMDGGDLVVLDGTVLVGQSSRTSHPALRELAHLLLPFGYRVKACGVRGTLHLKSACTAVDERTLLAHRPWVDLHRAAPERVLDVPPEEPHGANVVRVGETLLVSAQAPRTAERLEQEGYAVRQVDVSEFAKAEGALTCKSLFF
ncbi:MAG: dimethylargininase [Planctomycetota bacterium]